MTVKWTVLMAKMKEIAVSKFQTHEFYKICKIELIFCECSCNKSFSLENRFHISISVQIEMVLKNVTMFQSPITVSISFHSEKV